MRAPKVLRIFFEINLNNGHAGLTKIANKAGWSITRLDQGEFVIFINRAQTMVKCLTASGILLFYRSPQGRITLSAIKHIPGAFVSDGMFWMETAIRAALEKDLVKKDAKV